MADRFDEILAQLREDRAHSDRRFEELIAASDRRFEELIARTDENLRFLGELNRRNEIVLQDLLRESRAARAETRASIAETRASTAQLRKLTAETHAVIETTKAHTRAIFTFLDRFEGGKGGPATAT